MISFSRVDKQVLLIRVAGAVRSWGFLVEPEPFFFAGSCLGGDF